jgi:hypothetical protein
MPIENFYVYENWTNTFTKVHRGSCTYCRDGQGFHGARQSHAKRSVARTVLVAQRRHQ